ncbi:MAG: ribonuclease III [Oscillospiraceae bacterium]|jgi:ribonuclease-3|nr:ribonuclease III [Oscillospiraceae bacterium]
MNGLQLDELQERLGYRFKNTSLLKTALTHSSYANENKKTGTVSNERLEFLGDSVLGMAVAELVYRGNPKMPEGQMTRLRAELVCEKSLAALAADLKLGDCLLFGRGEEKGGGRVRPSILADAVEAVLASIYLDGGFRPVERLITEHFAPLANSDRFENTDYKTILQEVIQEKGGQLLSYNTIDESGPDHMKTFTVEVTLNGIVKGRGSGPSKKEAEQMAAKSALDRT